MNCFEWQCQSSDYLDGALPQPLQDQAEAHLESCTSCSAHSRHFQILVDTLSNEAKLPLPDSLRKTPLKRDLPRPNLSEISLSQWERIPWGIRTLVEGLSIIFFVVLGITYAPKLRSLYDGQVEKNLTDFRESPDIPETFGESLYAETPPLLTNLPSTAQLDEISGEDDTPLHPVRVGKSELWRFTLKTVSPDELRPQVVAALKELKIPQTTAGLGGVKVPGGIEFDLILAQSYVPQIKHSLEKLAPKPLEPLNEKKGNETFSWYKVKSRQQLPQGMSKIVIWLAQPN